MRVDLAIHPDFRCPAVRGIEVEVLRSPDDRLDLRYRLSGDIGGVRLPDLKCSERTDELWRTTCFEAFVRTEGEGYLELNFAPSTQWAAYRFDGYRAGMRAADVTPELAVATEADTLEVLASMDLRGAGPFGGPWRLALTAVIEAADGSVSYWSARHPAGKPDFHHPDGFALELPAPSRL